MALLDRRGFIGALAATALATRGSRAAPRKVIVVGAGMAGLAAGQALAGAGLDVTVIEARQRVGGRIATDRSLGSVVERGANWIHGVRGNPLTELAERSGTRLHRDDGDMRVFDADGKRVGDAALERAEAALETLLGRVDELDAEGLSLAAAVSRIDPGALAEPLSRWMLASAVELEFGAPIDALSAAEFDEDDGFPGRDANLVEGYDRLLEPLSAKLAIRLGEPARTITLDSDGVSVETALGVHQCEAAVVALPLGVLKAGSVALPPLPGPVRRAIERLEAGSVSTVALAFDRAFWGRTAYVGNVDPIPGRFPFFVSRMPVTGAPVLVGYTAGAHAAETAAWPDDRLAAEAVSVLRRIFGNKVPEPRGTLVTRWAADPHTLGAYASPGVGASRADFEAFSTVLEGRVVFAGEHTSADYRGTVHGAFLSGLRAAETLLRR